MPTIINNNFTLDSHAMRAERLVAIQTNLRSLESELQTPAEISAWALHCYSNYMTKWTESNVAQNEKESATFNLEQKILILEEEYQSVRNYAYTIYDTNSNAFRDFKFDEAFPDDRVSKIAKVNEVLEVYEKQKESGQTPILPEVLVLKLQEAATQFNFAYKEQNSAKNHARNTTADFRRLMEADAKQLQSLRAWWYAILGKKDERIGMIGMVNPEAGGSTGKVPPAPENLRLVRGEKAIDWFPSPGATSYELEMGEDGTTFEQIYQGEEHEYIFTEIPLVSYWRVRGRNAHGFGDYSQVLRAEYINPLPAPTDVQVEIDPSISNGLILSWDEVFSADDYIVMRSVVNIGEGPGELSLLASTQELQLKDIGIPHKRMWYRINASNLGQGGIPVEIHFDMPE